MHRIFDVRRIVAILGIALYMGASCAPVAAADLDTPIEFHIQAQPLESALLELSKEASIQLVLDSSVVAAKNSSMVSGKMPIREALDRLLRDTELTYRWSGDRTVTVAPRAMFRPTSELATPALEEVVVTAQKRTERLQDVPVSVSTVSGESLEAVHAT